MTPSRTVEVDNRGDNISTERRSYLEQKILMQLFVLGRLMVADLQIGAVGGKACLRGAGDPGSQITSGDSRPI